jgi:hypothetical protein
MSDKIIHIEDSEEWREKVGQALRHISGISITPLGSLDEFYSLQKHDVKFYILDRHFPPKRGENPNDDSWRIIAGSVKELGVFYPNNGIVMLTHCPPENGDWRRYKNIRNLFRKQDFNPEDFAKNIEFYLNNPIGE